MNRVLPAVLLLSGTVITGFSQIAYYVSTTGDDENSGLSEADAWRTLTFSVSTESPVSAGDTVYVKAGDYENENVILCKSGTAESSVVIEGYQTVPGDNPSLDYSYGDPLDPSVMPLFDGGNRTVGTGLDLSGESYVTVKNIQITNYEAGVYTWSYSNTGLIIDNIIVMNVGDINDPYSGLGIGIVYSNGCTVQNSIVVNSCAEGISVTADSTLLDNCKVFCGEDFTEYASTDYYIVLTEANYNYVKDCYVERVGDLEHGGAGIGVKGNCVYNVFENCTVKDLENGGFYVRHSGACWNEFKNCTAIGTLSDVNGYLIRDGASHNTFNSCVADNCSSAICFLISGEDANYCGRYNVFNNCIVTNSTWAVDFLEWALPGPADNNLFANCVFYNSAWLFHSGRENFGNAMVNCVVSNIDSLVTGAEPLSFGFGYSDFYNNGFGTPSGTGNISENPLFVNASSGDFHMQEGSPCIDTGTPENAPDYDFNWDPRPCGSGYDIGIFEYQESGIVETEGPSWGTVSLICSPNPFSSRTTISYNMPLGAFVKVAVYDVSGRLVQELADEYEPAGENTLQWNGYGGSPVRVPEGVYFVCIDSGGFSEIRKVAVLY